MVLGVAAAAALSAACFTYSASITMEPSPSMASPELASLARSAVVEVAETFGMEPSLIDLEAMQRAARDESSEYQPIAVYRSTRQSAVRDSNRIILVLQQRIAGDGVRVIIRDLERDEATQFTESVEQEIVTRLASAVGSENVRVERGRIGPSIYAP